MNAEVVLICRELDFAVIRVVEKNNEHLLKECGEDFIGIMKSVCNLKMNARQINTVSNSASEIYAIGFPLNAKDMCVSKGVISAYEDNYLQLDLSINHGNSGGPLISDGRCIGILTASYDEAESFALAIPWSMVDSMLKDYKMDEVIQYPPNLGVNTKRLIEAYCENVLNADCKGALVTHAHEEGPLKMLQKDDIVCVIGDNKIEMNIDCHGLVKVPYQTQKVPFQSLHSMFLLDKDTSFVVYYRKRKYYRKHFKIYNYRTAIKEIMPLQEPQTCVLFAGLVFVQLLKNHIDDINSEEERNDAFDFEILNFLDKTHCSKNAVVVSAIHHPCSVIKQGYSVLPLTVITKINGKEIETLAEAAKLMQESSKAYCRNKKKRYVVLTTAKNDDLHVDMKLAFECEQLLEQSASYPSQFSLIKGRKRRRNSR